MLLKHFQKQNTPEEERIKDQSAKFFQDADGQMKPVMTVADMLSQLTKD